MTAGKIIAGVAIGSVVAAGAGLTWYFAGGGLDRPLKENEPDSPAVPGKTGWKRVDAILDKLKEVARKTGIPLGLMVGWIAKESGGKLSDTTSLDERGYFQLMPSESSKLGLDHQRLSTDSDYSIDAGVDLIRSYQSKVNDLNVIPAGNSYYWRLVKLGHSMGASQMQKVVRAAIDAGQADSWDSLESFALDMHLRGPQPKKWFPFVDSVYKVGRPFGFGSEAPASVGQAEWAVLLDQGFAMPGSFSMTESRDPYEIGRALFEGRAKGNEVGDGLCLFGVS